MIDQKKIESTIVNGLQDYLGCPVILANQHSPAPSYPYVSFTVTSLKTANNGAYGTEYNGVFYKHFKQRWSFTVQSDDDNQCSEITLKTYDWFSLVAVTFLSDNEIYIERLEDISNRDNLITIQYEYRRGFDVTFVIMDVIEPDFEIIESVHLGKDREIEMKNIIDEIHKLLEIEHGGE